MGEILPEVVAEALRQGGALLSSSREPKPDAMRGKGGGQEMQGSQGRGGGAGAACRPGDTIVAELSARAERSGWSTSVLFLEKTGAVRLRLVRQCEERGAGDGLGLPNTGEGKLHRGGLIKS